MNTPNTFTAIVADKQQLSPHVYEFTWKLEDGTLQFVPGQYASFIIDAQTRRQYSFAAPMEDPTQFHMVIDIAPMGVGSTFFLDKKVGDSVQVLAPLGMFHFTEPVGPTVFIATGTGIVPFRTMIEEYLKQGGKQEIYLYWGLRYSSDIFWQNILSEWEKTYQNFHLRIVLSKPEVDWDGKTGHVTEHIVEEITPLSTHTFYLCGNRHMISDVKTSLLAQSVPEEQIKTELF